VAIDESLEVDADSEVRKSGGAGPAKTMFEVWKRHSMDKHALTKVPLSKKNEAEISETVKQYAEKKEVLVDGHTEVLLVLPQIKYMYPAIPKKKVSDRLVL
jgi:cellobiose-specific phosphotransferase system component IIB